MYVIKESELVLQGTRNNFDVVWDIPVYKTKISDDNFMTQIINATLRIIQESRTARLINRPDNHTSQELKTPSPRTLCNVF